MWTNASGASRLASGAGVSQLGDMLRYSLSTEWRRIKSDMPLNTWLRKILASLTKS
jgi:hypothetical protein